MNHFFHLAALGLVLLSVLALYANEHWMHRGMQIDLTSDQNISAIDDRSEGGKSIAKLSRITRGMEMECKIVAEYQWPFCELVIKLTDRNSGVNLNQFDSLRLQIRSSGPEPQNPVRVFLRNFNSAYSTADDPSSLKPHEVVFDPNLNVALVEFKLSQFMVASWWTQAHPTSIEHMGPELDQVVALSFITGGNVIPGKHTITIESIEFIGQWIPTEHFRLGIIFMWLSVVVAYLIWEWRLSRQELRESVRLKQALELNNQALEERVEERTKALASSNARLIETLQNLEGTRYELVQNEKNAALGSLVSGIAHELNTPIGNSLLISTTLSDKVKELEIISETKFTRKALKDFFNEANRGTDILQKNLERAANLISSFKQLSADQHSEQRRQFRLIDVVEETQLAMAPSIRLTSHQFNIDIEPDILMDAYPGPLSQIFINLINNALLHGFDKIEQGHMLLTAKLRNEDSVEIIFSDDGNGIPATILRRVFEPFFTTKLGKGGSGLGMHLAHTVVTQLFGGKIEIQSLPGEGTSVRMLLPLVAPQIDQNLIRLGVPKDVLEDYQLFLNSRANRDIEEFGGMYSRRDVVELAFFIRALETVRPNAEFTLIAIDSYAHGIEQLRQSAISCLATTCWESDLIAYAEEICISPPMISDGLSNVGIYTAPHNQLALRCKTLDDFRQLRLVSNRDWSADWNTLKHLGIDNCLDVKTWRQMVYMVSGNEVDALLAPFAIQDEFKIELDDCQLIPVPGLRIALRGSRHFACGKSPQAVALAKAIFPELNRYLDDGSFIRALEECGFINTLTSSWTILNQTRTDNNADNKIRQKDFPLPE